MPAISSTNAQPRTCPVPAPSPVLLGPCSAQLRAGQLSHCAGSEWIYTAQLLLLCSPHPCVRWGSEGAQCGVNENQQKLLPAESSISAGVQAGRGLSRL